MYHFNAACCNVHLNRCRKSILQKIGASIRGTTGVSYEKNQLICSPYDFGPNGIGRQYMSRGATM